MALMMNSDVMSLDDIQRIDETSELYMFLGHVMPLTMRRTLFQDALSTAAGRVFDKMRQFLLQEIRNKY